MKVYNFNNSILENWWSLLRNLNNDIKLELASRLIDSMKKPTPPINEGDDSWKKLSGAWNDEEESAEELIKFIRESRISTRQIESLD